jgi:hypothetical protein
MAKFSTRAITDKMLCHTKRCAQELRIWNIVLYLSCYRSL